MSPVLFAAAVVLSTFALTWHDLAGAVAVVASVVVVPGRSQPVERMNRR